MGTHRTIKQTNLKNIIANRKQKRRECTEQVKERLVKGENIRTNQKVREHIQQNSIGSNRKKKR